MRTLLQKILIISFTFFQALTAGIAQTGIISTEPDFQSSIIDPVLERQIANNHYFFDFGKDAFGTLVLDLNIKAPANLVIHLGEKLISEWTIDRNPGGSIKYRRIVLPVTPAVSKYVVRIPPDERNTNPPAVSLPDSFGVVMPFRYCEIENLDASPVLNRVRKKAYFYRFSDSSSYFTSSDTILNNVWDLCKYSIKATSFAGYYIDGDRERIPYEADAYINQLSHYSVDSEYSLARRTNEYFIDHPTWPTEWQLYTVLMFYNDYMYTGDISSIEKYYEALKVKTLSELARSDGLVSSKSDKLTDDFMSRLGFSDNKQRIRDIVDWPPAQKDTGWKLASEEGERDGYEMVDVNTVVNSLYFAALKKMAEIAGWLGKNSDSEKFIDESERVRQVINKILINQSKGIYVDGENSLHSSLHANMFPLAFGLVPEENMNSVIEFIKSRGMACSVYGSQILLDGLYSANVADYALELLTSVSDRSWWNMIRSGSTITMEAWDMKYKPNSDWNHAWGAAPANIITRQLWGIQPLEPGFKRAMIRPQTGSLSYSVINVPTITGTITAVFQAEKNRIKLYSIDIPPGMVADFMPEDPDQVYVNNKRIRRLPGKIELEPGHYEIRVVQ